MSSVYLIGSLRNPVIPELAQALRGLGHEVFDDWHAVGPEADDHWKTYEVTRGRTYTEALQGYTASHVFDYDVSHIDRCDTSVLVLPAGRSGHLELGYATGRGKRTFILRDDPDRWDMMYRFVYMNGGAVVDSQAELIEVLN